MDEEPEIQKPPQPPEPMVDVDIGLPVSIFIGFIMCYIVFHLFASLF